MLNVQHSVHSVLNQPAHTLDCKYIVVLHSPGLTYLGYDALLFHCCHVVCGGIFASLFIPAAIANMYPLHIMLCDPATLLPPCPLSVLMPSPPTHHHGITQVHAEDLPPSTPQQEKKISVS